MPERSASTGGSAALGAEALPPSLSRATRDEYCMRRALAEAEGAAAVGDVPVGAVVLHGDMIIAAAANRTMRDQDPTAHAEVLAMRAASAALGSWRLDHCTLVVTLEPCAMCAGAIVLARIPRVVFGAWDEKAGMAGSIEDLLRHPRLNHHPEVQGGVLGEAAAVLLRRFFGNRR